MRKLISTVIIAAAMISAIPAYSAEAQLTPTATGANYSVRVMSWADIPFRTVVRQQYDFSCGSAAVATLLTHQWGIKTSEAEPFKAMWAKGDQTAIKTKGFSMLDMKQYLESRGIKAVGYRYSVTDIAKARQPGIALIDLKGFKHFVVVKGVASGKVLVGDSILGLTEYPAAEFTKMWNGIYLTVQPANDGRKPIFNLRSDWGPWSRAPIDENSGTSSIATLTGDLPPIYQLRPEILLDVRVGTVQ
jgi:uncharacterized protein